MRMIWLVILVLVLPFCVRQLYAAENDAGGAQPVQGFESVLCRSVHFWCDGTKLSGDLTYPREFSAAEKYPCIVMCPGWGG